MDFSINSPLHALHVYDTVVCMHCGLCVLLFNEEYGSRVDDHRLLYGYNIFGCR